MTDDLWDMVNKCQLMAQGHHPRTVIDLSTGEFSLESRDDFQAAFQQAERFGDEIIISEIKKFFPGKWRLIDPSEKLYTGTRFDQYSFKRFCPVGPKQSLNVVIGVASDQKMWSLCMGGLSATFLDLPDVLEALSQRKEAVRSYLVTKIADATEALGYLDTMFKDS